jgi:hypothetical protein
VAALDLGRHGGLPLQLIPPTKSQVPAVTQRFSDRKSALSLIAYFLTCVITFFTLFGYSAIILYDRNECPTGIQFEIKSNKEKGDTGYEKKNR